MFKQKKKEKNIAEKKLYWTIKLNTIITVSLCMVI